MKSEDLTFEKSSIRRFVFALSAFAIGLAPYWQLLPTLRRTFGFRKWPYVNAFFTTPGHLMWNFVTVYGLVYCLKRVRIQPTVYRFATIGFGLLLAKELLETLIGGWLLASSQKLGAAPGSPMPGRRSFWYQWHYIDIPELIAAAGLALIIVALMRALRMAGSTHLS